MTDSAKAPDPPLAPPPSGLPSQLAAALALITALGGVVATWRGYEGGQDTQRMAYEALRMRSELQGRQIEELVRTQAEMRDWMDELTRRLEARTSNTEKAIRKVAKPKQVVTPLIPAEPPPPPPAPPATPEVQRQAPLPSFEQLSE